MQKLTLVPAFISSLRLAVLPLFIYLYSADNVAGCLVLLVFSAATDFLDGYLARKLKATSNFGAYYDVATDFILVVGIYSIFTAKGYYPIWLVLLIAASFVQFLATSVYAKKLYDPVGKYIGSALYIGIVLTLLWPIQAIFIFVEVAFAGFFIASLASRAISFSRKTRKVN
jgi:phosphatidylglycerophosphate synthase